MIDLCRKFPSITIYIPKIIVRIPQSIHVSISLQVTDLSCGTTINRPIYTGQIVTIYRLRNGTFVTPIETIHGLGQQYTQWCLHHWSDINLRSPFENNLTDMRG